MYQHLWLTTERRMTSFASKLYIVGTRSFEHEMEAEDYFGRIQQE